MKAAKIVLVVVFFAAMVNSARLDYRYFLPQVIPGCHGSNLSKYDIVGIVLVVNFIYLFMRIGKRSGQSKSNKPYDHTDKQNTTDIYSNRYR